MVLHDQSLSDPGGRRSRGQWAVVGLLVAFANCAGDPYARYGAAVHEDVDAAMMAAFRMSARMNLTVVHNAIPMDSLALIAALVTKTSRTVAERASHFAALQPPPDLATAHAALSAELSRLGRALDVVGSTFRGCADARAAGDSSGDTCRANLAALPSSFAYVGEDLRVARNRVQRLLRSHGVILPAMASG